MIEVIFKNAFFLSLKAGDPKQLSIKYLLSLRHKFIEYFRGIKLLIQHSLRATPLSGRCHQTLTIYNRHNFHLNRVTPKACKQLTPKKQLPKNNTKIRVKFKCSDAQQNILHFLTLSTGFFDIFFGPIEPFVTIGLESREQGKKLGLDHNRVESYSFRQTRNRRVIIVMSQFTTHQAD